MCELYLFFREHGESPLSRKGVFIRRGDFPTSPNVTTYCRLSPSGKETHDITVAVLN